MSEIKTKEIKPQDAKFKNKKYGNYIEIDKLNEVIEISSAEDFLCIDENPNGIFKLIKDIDLKKYDEFKSIEGFNGILLGNGKTIRNIEINGLDNVGLFSILGEKSLVKDLTLENVNINGINNVGSIAGINRGRIVNCSVIGENYIHGTGCVGGLVGKSDTGDIDNCCVYIYNLTGIEYIGGLVGKNESDIHSCEVVAPIGYGGKEYSNQGFNGIQGIKYLGGLIGFNSGDINRCYLNVAIFVKYEVTNEKNIKNDEYIGCLIGFNKKTENYNAVKYCKVYGRLWGHGNVYKLIGKNEGIIGQNILDVSFM